MDEVELADYDPAWPVMYAAEAARLRAALKRELAVRHRDDREAYTEAKTAYVEAVLTKARGG